MYLPLPTIGSMVSSFVLVSAATFSWAYYAQDDGNRFLFCAAGADANQPCFLGITHIAAGVHANGPRPVEDRPMHDIVIRGGTIIDGAGGAAFTGDIAIDGGRIAAVGGKAGPARRDIAADGLLVTPGWVDVHTHYDGQATWDPMLAPSS